MGIRTLCACAALVFAVAGHAEQTLLDVRPLLANPGFTVVDLQEENGRTVGRLDRTSVQRLVDVSTRLAATYGMQAPQVFIALSTSPMASADWHSGHLRVEINPVMLELVGGNADTLAAVVAHVMAHVQASHVNAEFSRDQEIEADRLALRAMADAGFNPQGAAVFWQMIRTHPRAWWNDSHPWYPERDKVIGAAVAAAPMPKVAAPVAAATDAKAMGVLALKYVQGDGGVEKDYGKARTYAERAADGGDLLGLAVLGALMRDGIGGFANAERGLAYLDKAAQGGNAWAHYQLGLSYERGLGVTPDRDKALAQYKAAAADVPEAARRAAALAR